jgi:hypothetical protein
MNRDRQWECDLAQATTQVSVTSRTIAVDHIGISSERSFTDVRRKLEGTVPKLDTGIAEALQRAKTVDLRRAQSWKKIRRTVTIER